jgi:hypothetical protein
MEIYHGGDHDTPLLGGGPRQEAAVAAIAAVSVTYSCICVFRSFWMSPKGTVKKYTRGHNDCHLHSTVWDSDFQFFKIRKLFGFTHFWVSKRKKEHF